MNKTVVITGAARGIGKECALAFGKNGWSVAVMHFKTDPAPILSELTSLGCDCAAFKADVRDSAQVKAAFAEISKRFYRIDALINNAGISKQGLLCDTSDADWSDIISTNLNSVFYCTREALPHMLSKKSGRIVNISSMWGLRAGSYEVPYSASKAAIIGLTRSLAQELAPSGITINAIAPGVIMTDMCSGLGSDILDDLREQTPVGRLGMPTDVAQAALFLAQSNSSFITGQVLTVDGGFTL